MDIGIERFELAADSRQVGIHWTQFDVVCHVDCVEAESVRGGFDWKIVRAAERNVQIECRAISGSGWSLDCTAKCECSSMLEVLAAPGSPLRLPRANGWFVHCCTAPSINWGGVKGWTWRAGEWIWVLWKSECESASATTLCSPGIWKTCNWMCDQRSKSTVVVRRGLYSGWALRLLNMLTVLELSEKIARQLLWCKWRCWTAQPMANMTVRALQQKMLWLPGTVVKGWWKPMLPVGYQKPKPKGHVSQKSVILALLTPHPVAEITFFFFF